MELKGKVAIVTGGTKGIGRAIAEALVREGVNVCISARSRSEIDETLDALCALKAGNANGIVSDVCNYSQVKPLFELTVGQFGGLDILVNNAGIGLFQTVEEMSPEDFETERDPQLDAAVQTLLAILEGNAIPTSQPTSIPAFTATPVQ